MPGRTRKTDSAISSGAIRWQKNPLLQLPASDRAVAEAGLTDCTEPFQVNSRRTELELAIPWNLWCNPQLPLTSTGCPIYPFGVSHSGGAALDTAKVFWSGRSQAVRLPKEYRFECDEVRIRRAGNAIILEPIPSDWTWLDAAVRELSPEYLVEGREQPDPQTRQEVDELFP
jgi:antitoxin VapB